MKAVLMGFALFFFSTSIYSNANKNSTTYPTHKLLTVIVVEEEPMPFKKTTQKAIQLGRLRLTKSSKARKELFFRSKKREIRLV